MEYGAETEESTSQESFSIRVCEELAYCGVKGDKIIITELIKVRLQVNMISVTRKNKVQMNNSILTYETGTRNFNNQNYNLHRC